eukprot:g9956.t1
MTCMVFGKAAGVGTDVSDLHRYLHGTGCRRAGQELVEITGLKPNTNYCFATMYFEGFEELGIGGHRRGPGDFDSYSLRSFKLRLDVAERFPPAVLAAFAQLVLLRHRLKAAWGAQLFKAGWMR